MDSPQLSIIIPCYNAASTIQQTLDSIVTQTFTSYEVIIMDGLSGDNTAALVKPYTERDNFWFVSEKDKGVYDAMNKGIEQAKGRFLYFLGADDTLYDSGVLQHIFNDQELLSVDMIYGNAYFTIRKEIYDGPFNLEKLLLQRKNICHQAIFYSSRIFRELGNYNLDYKILADYDFNLRIFLSGNYVIKYVSRTISNFSDNGLSSTKIDEAFKKDLVYNYVLRQYSGEDIYYRYINELRRNVALEKKMNGLPAIQYFKTGIKRLLKGKIW